MCTCACVCKVHVRGSQVAHAPSHAHALDALTEACMVCATQRALEIEEIEGLRKGLLHAHVYMYAHTIHMCTGALELEEIELWLRKGFLTKAATHQKHAERELPNMATHQKHAERQIPTSSPNRKRVGVAPARSSSGLPHAYLYVCMGIHICMHTHVRMHACAYTYACIRIYVCR